MKAFAISFVIFAAQPPSGEVNAVQGSSAQTPQPWEQQLLAAEDLFRQNRYREASAAFESLWEEYRQPLHLFNAGVSRFASGHYAHAIEHLEAFLKLPHTPENLRATAREQIEQAGREIGAVTIGVTSPEATGPVEVELEYVGASGGRPKLVVMSGVGVAGELRTVQQQIRLDPGVWRVSTHSQGYVDAQTSVEVAKRGGTQSVLLELQPLQQSEPAPEPRHRLGFGLLGSGSALTISGAVILGLGHLNYRAAKEDELNSECNIQCVENFRPDLNVRSAGTTVFGIGLGTLSVGSIAFIRKPRTRKIAWFSTAGLGAGLVIAGSILNISGARRAEEHIGEVVRWVDIKYFEDLESHATRQTVGGALLGFGIGAVASSVIGLVDTYVLERRASPPTKRASIQVQPMVFGQAGAVVSGRF